MTVDTRISPSMILVNGKIITVDQNNSIQQALAIRDDKIIAVGTATDILSLKGENTKVIDLEGKPVLPGFIDTHSHPGVAATVFLQLNCISPPTNSVKEILENVRHAAAKTKPGDWIRGINYNQLKLEEKRHITKEELDEAAPENPVVITRLTGHMYVLNTLALERAGITRETPDPEGGRIDKDSQGRLTGLLHGNAGDLVLGKMPEYTVEDIKEGLKKVFDQYSEWGVTTVHDPGTTATDLRAYKELIDEGHKQVRVQCMMRTHRESPRKTLEEMIALGIESSYGNDWLKIMSLKIMGDGTGSGGTAGVYEPQARGDTLGLFMTSPEEMKKLTVLAQKHGIRVSIHSIGDRAIDAALDGIEEAQRLYPVSDMRHRIEHNSICTPKQLERIKGLGVAPASSIGYMWSIGDDYMENFGEKRMRWCHPHKTMQEMGIVAGGNCDYPITDGNPVVQIQQAVTRKTRSDLVYSPEEAISVMDAIRVFTWNGAYLEKEEHMKGSIEVGKLADLVILDKDVLCVPSDEIDQVKALTTITGGRVVYQA